MSQVKRMKEENISMQFSNNCLTCVSLDDEDDDEEREAEPYSTVVETDFKFSDFVHR